MTEVEQYVTPTPTWAGEGLMAAPSDGTRIVEIRVHRRELPVTDGSYRMGLSSVECLDSTVVEVITESGLVGYGETCPVGPTYQPHHALGARAALAQVAPALIGHDARFIGLAHRLMDDALAGHAYAKAALDIALWDLLGKVCGLRVCDLLGGTAGDRVPSYWSLIVSEPDECAQVAAEKQAMGFRRIQLKVGGRTIEEDIEAIRKVSGVLEPGVRLAVDANRSWTAAEAITVSRLCEDLMLVLEQPCDTFEEIAALRGRVRHPVFLDEAIVDLRALNRAITEGLAQGFGLKATRLGGISAFRTVRDVCDAYHVPHTCDDAWGGDVIAAACVHVAATVRPRLLAGVWIAAPYIGEHYDPENGVRIVNGSIEVPSAPGLGVVPATEQWGPPVASYA